MLLKIFGIIRMASLGSIHPKNPSKCCSKCFYHEPSPSFAASTDLPSSASSFSSDCFFIFLSTETHKFLSAGTLTWVFVSDEPDEPFTSPLLESVGLLSVSFGLSA